MSMTKSGNTLPLVAMALLLVNYPEPSYAASTVTLGSDIPAAERVPVENIGHGSWDALLKKYVDSQGMVDYTAWKNSRDDMRALDQYLDQLSKADTAADATKADRLAFWINAYNAVTVRGILREYPTTSIRNHTARLFGYNIWDDLQLYVGGKLVSLNQMEHEILRKMNEPRIHFALVCASIGCPRLLQEAYVPEKIDQQLTANAKAFFADPAKFQFEVQDQLISVSPILDWYGEDFGKTTAAQLQQIAPYLPEAARELAKSGEARVRYLDYDWDLNDQARE